MDPMDFELPQTSHASPSIPSSSSSWRLHAANESVQGSRLMRWTPKDPIWVEDECSSQFGVFAGRYFSHIWTRRFRFSFSNFQPEIARVYNCSVNCGDVCNPLRKSARPKNTRNLTVKHKKVQTQAKMPFRGLIPNHRKESGISIVAYLSSYIIDIKDNPPFQTISSRFTLYIEDIIVL